MKKLKDPREPLEKPVERVSILGAKLGPMLVQLPPRWTLNSERLEDFLEILSGDQRYAFEFRTPVGSTTELTGFRRNGGVILHL
jgi:uncharacterized protein YecE (DUF72 family)